MTEKSSVFSEWSIFFIFIDMYSVGNASQNEIKGKLTFMWLNWIEAAHFLLNAAA